MNFFSIKGNGDWFDESAKGSIASVRALERFEIDRRARMARAFAIKPLDATFGAVVTGTKLASLDDATWHALYTTWLEYALLIFPDQHLSHDEQVACAKRFGQLEFN